MKPIKQIGAILFISCSVHSPIPALAATPKPSDNSDWVAIVSSSDNSMLYSGKKGSFELTSTKGEIPIAVLLGQTENKKNKSITYNKWYVSTSDCERGLGKIVFLKISGDFDFEVDYVSKGDSVGSSIADAICTVYKSVVEANDAKGI